MTTDPVAAGGFAAATPTSARIRPTFARRAIGVVKASCPKGARVLEVGAGTGILTGQLRRAGLAVAAIESDGSSLVQLRRSQPSVPVARAEAGSLPVAPSTIGLVVVGRSTDRSRPEEIAGEVAVASLIAEAHRVLRPGGVLAVLSNVADTSVPWVSALHEMVDGATVAHGDVPRSDPGSAASWSGTVERSGGFGTIRVEAFANPALTTTRGVLDRVRAMGAVAALDERDRDALLRNTADLLDGHPELRGTFEFPQHTVVLLCESLER